MAESRYYNVTDIMAMMEVKETKAYAVISALNNELKALGKITLPGRVPKSYYHLRTDIEEIAENPVRQKGKAVRAAI